MSATIDQAIEALRNLPPERQEALAHYICDLAADDQSPEEVDPADLPSVLIGLEQMKNRQFADPERVKAILGFKDA